MVREEIKGCPGLIKVAKDRSERRLQCLRKYDKIRTSDKMDEQRRKLPKYLTRVYLGLMRPAKENEATSAKRQVKK